MANEIIPIYINGKHLKYKNEDNFKNNIYKIFEEQYDRDFLERYKQFPKRKKAIIVDDFHKFFLSDKARSFVLEMSENIFGKVILLMEDDLMLQEVIGYKKSNKYLDRYQKCRIREFGYSLRSDLIRKWNCIGLDPIEHDTREIEDKCIEMEDKVNTVIGKNLLPRYPIFILLILQQFETRERLDTSASTYGYLYESLITKHLTSISKNTGDINMNSTYLSELAYYMFNNNFDSVDISDMEKVTIIYNKKYAMKLFTCKIIEQYKEAEVLSVEEEQCKFRYKYMYYFFVAKYLKSEMDSIDVITHINNMSSKLYNEDYANIIIFLCHLTMENYVINEILKNSKNIFKEFEPYNLDEHNDFIRNMCDKIPEVIYIDGEPEKNRRAMLENKDEMAASSEKEYYEYHGEEDEGRDINNIIEINKSYKTIQILGQIVKNFPGSLKASVKYEIIKGTYLLGLRTANVFMTIIDNNIKDMVKELKEIYIEKNNVKEVDEKFIEERAEDFILWFSEMVILSIIKKVSSSVNNDKLSETYRELVEENQTTSFKIIDISVKLDLLERIPEKDIIELNKEIEGNYFTQSILKHLVVLNFYLYRSDYKVKQRLCNKLGISYKNIRLYEAKTKELNGTM